MQIKCSGYPKLSRCNNDVPFVIDKQSITFQLGAGGHSLSIDLAKVVGELSAVMPANAQVTKYIGKLEIFCLCGTCWGKASDAWAVASQNTASPQKASDYASAAAKATPQGLFFQAHEETFKVSGKVDLDCIRSTTVHELVHWTVADTTQGFQQLAGGTDTIIGLSSWSWDEVLTDHLAHKCYKRMRYGDYKTNYGNYLEFIDKAADAVNAKSGFAFKRIKESISNAFNFDAAASEADFKLWIQTTYKQKLFEELCFRYVNGASYASASGKCPSNFKQFAEAAMVPFASAISLSAKVF